MGLKTATSANTVYRFSWKEPVSGGTMRLIVVPSWNFSLPENFNIFATAGSGVNFPGNAIQLDNSKLEGSYTDDVPLGFFSQTMSFDVDLSMTSQNFINVMTNSHQVGATYQDTVELTYTNPNTKQWRTNKLGTLEPPGTFSIIKNIRYGNIFILTYKSKEINSNENILFIGNQTFRNPTISEDNILTVECENIFKTVSNIMNTEDIESVFGLYNSPFTGENILEMASNNSEFTGSGFKYFNIYDWFQKHPVIKDNIHSRMGKPHLVNFTNVNDKMRFYLNSIQHFEQFLSHYGTEIFNKLMRKNSSDTFNHVFTIDLPFLDFYKNNLTNEYPSIATNFDLLNEGGQGAKLTKSDMLFISTIEDVSDVDPYTQVRRDPNTKIYAGFLHQLKTDYNSFWDIWLDLSAQSMKRVINVFTISNNKVLSLTSSQPILNKVDLFEIDSPDFVRVFKTQRYTNIIETVETIPNDQPTNEHLNEYQEKNELSIGTSKKATFPYIYTNLPFNIIEDKKYNLRRDVNDPYRLMANTLYPYNQPENILQQRGLQNSCIYYITEAWKEINALNDPTPKQEFVKDHMKFSRVHLKPSVVLDNSAGGKSTQDSLAMNAFILNTAPTSSSSPSSRIFNDYFLNSVERIASITGVPRFLAGLYIILFSNFKQTGFEMETNMFYISNGNVENVISSFLIPLKGIKLNSDVFTNLPGTDFRVFEDIVGDYNIIENEMDFNGNISIKTLSLAEIDYV